MPDLCRSFAPALNTLSAAFFAFVLMLLNALMAFAVAFRHFSLMESAVFRSLQLMLFFSLFAFSFAVSIFFVTAFFPLLYRLLALLRIEVFVCFLAGVGFLAGVVFFDVVFFLLAVGLAGVLFLAVFDAGFAAFLAAFLTVLAAFFMLVFLDFALSPPGSLLFTGSFSA